jgi:NADPH:quinone reductase-like Zn-dependent oxidoreductase
MIAARVHAFSESDPLSGLRVDDLPEPEVPEGWLRIDLKAAALNGHDIWSLKGVGLSRDDLPRTLGSDGAGVVRGSGERVVVYPLISAFPPQTTADLDPIVSPLLSERHDGTLATSVVVPAHCMVPLPDGLSFEEGAALPTAWLTAYRMLFRLGECAPGETILVQGATGGVATALVKLASVTGVRAWVVARTEEGRDWALKNGANQVFAPDSRLPSRVDAVMETVGEATWEHSLRCLRVGGRIVVAGATTGGAPSADLQRVFFRQLRVVGARMGTLAEFRSLIQLLEDHRIAPPIDSVTPLADVEAALYRLVRGGLRGKMVIGISAGD